MVTPDQIHPDPIVRVDIFNLETGEAIVPTVKATFEIMDGSEEEFDTEFQIPQSLADLIHEFTDSLGIPVEGEAQVKAHHEFLDPAWDRIESELLRLALERFPEMRNCGKLELAHCDALKD